MGIHPAHDHAVLHEVQVREGLPGTNECRISRRLNKQHLKWFPATGEQVLKFANID